MIVSKMPVEYEIRTRNMRLMFFLDIMSNKYGIDDYAMWTATTWDHGPLEISPSEEKKPVKKIEKNKEIDLSDLLLDQYLRT